MKNHIIHKLLLVIFLLSYTSILSQNKKELIKLVITPPSNPIENFKGFGAEWDSRAYNFNGVNDDDFKLITERIKWMKIPIVRIMMQTKWCYSQSLGYDWNNENMNLLYRHLDFCQKNGIEVVLCDWGIEVDWLAVDGISKTDDPKYLEVIGNYLDYLVNQKNYTCIKYFNLVNEPNYEVGNFERWKNGVDQLFQVLKDKNLYSKIKIAAPGFSNDKEWFLNTVDEIRYALEVYDVHLYAWKESTSKGGVQNILKELFDYAKSLDQYSGRKLFFVSEAGMRDGQSAAISTQIDSFDYGVFMTDYAIQAVHAGANAVLAWMLDDNSHPDFQWGLWRNKQNDLTFRPWFYTWSLLCRLFQPESEIFKVRSRSIDLRALASKKVTGDKTDWSFAFVNVSDKPLDILLRVDDESSYTFNQYIYSENKYLVDNNGFPKPNTKFEINLTTGKIFEIPAYTVMFLTTIKN